MIGIIIEIYCGVIYQIVLISREHLTVYVMTFGPIFNNSLFVIAKSFLFIIQNIALILSNA